MIAVAIDTATDRCSVAATDGERVECRSVDGARRHAREILGLITDVLDALDARPADVSHLITADGPGSFTGLRVSAAVAKAIAWHRQVTWQVIPSLLGRAAAHAPAGGGIVVGTSDALRGELFAGCWQITTERVVRIGPAPRAMLPQTLEQFGPVDVVVGTIPDALVEAVRAATGHQPITGSDALPDARTLLRVRSTPGAATTVDHPARWEPDYGRPAEAQAQWERAHGRPVPVATDRSI